MDFSFDPHQLDFDWRFSPASVELLGKRLVPGQRLLLVGCPSLVQIAEQKVSSGLLIERNPYHDETTKFLSVRADVRYYRARRRFRNAFDSAIFDAPWYPDEFLRWAGLALAYTKRGGTISFSMWPEDVRPSAVQEHREIFRHLKCVGRLERLGGLSYDAPVFEQKSVGKLSSGASFSREGLLFSLTKLSDHPLIPIHFKKSQIFWKRYRIGPHQLGLKLNVKDKGRTADIHFDVPPFILSNTSRRNLEIERVNVWASNNVAARVKDPFFLELQLAKLRCGGQSSKGKVFLERMGLIASGDKLEWGETWTHRA